MNEPVRISTAHGRTTFDYAILTRTRGVPEEVRALKVGNTPPLLSVGRRCLNDGYSFVWLSGRSPYFVTSDGNITPCLVYVGVPYVDTEDPRCKPRPATVLWKGSNVKVVDREGEQGGTMVIIGAIFSSDCTSELISSRKLNSPFDL